MHLTLQSIQKSFADKKVLKDITFTFEEGKIYGLLGRNGAGKTTLFNCLSDEIQPDAGEALLEAPPQPPRKLDPGEVGYVLSTPLLPDFLTGYEYIKFIMEISAGTALDEHAPDAWFDLVSLEAEDRHRLIKGYSQGMKNKLQMLGCLIASPPVVLLDEPLTSLDVVVALEMKKLLQTMKSGRILILSTHILQLATDLCDEIVVLHDGQLQLIDQQTLHSSDFEERLVAILSEESEEAPHVQPL